MLKIYIGEAEIIVEVDYDYEPGREAKTDTLPEYCYPAEAAAINVFEVIYNSVDITDILSAKIIACLEEKCIENEEN